MQVFDKLAGNVPPAWLAVAMPANDLFSVKCKHFREDNLEWKTI